MLDFVVGDTVSVSSLHFLLMTSFSTTGPEPIELVERVEQHLVVHCTSPTAELQEPHKESCLNTTKY